MENNEWKEEQDPLGINGILLYREHQCPVCNRNVKNEKDKIKTRFLAGGSQREWGVCVNCGNRRNFAKEKFLINQFGYYFVTE